MIIEETFSKISHHSGPLPAPTDLAAYEAIQSGFAERIMQMAEKEQSNRISTLSQVVDRDYRERGRGQHYALASVVVLAGLAAFVAYLGNTNAAAWVATAAIVGIVGIFVTGRLAPVRDVDYEADETPQG